jgi:hypothetical protein
MDAYLLLQRGLWHLQKRIPAHTAEGIRLFKEAAELAPTYSLAWAALARATAYRAENSPDKASRDRGYAEAGVPAGN